MHRTLAILGVGASGACDRRGAATFGRRKIADAADQLVSVFARHREVRNHQVRVPRRECAPRLACGRRNPDLRAAAFEHLAEQLTGVGVVVDDQQFEFGLWKRAHRQPWVLLRKGR